MEGLCEELEEGRDGIDRNTYVHTEKSNNENNIV